MCVCVYLYVYMFVCVYVRESNTILTYRDNLVSDIFHGCFVVTCTLSAFISLVWLREQILHGGGPDWLDQDIQHEVGTVIMWWVQLLGCGYS